MKVTEDIRYVGVNDEEIDLFEGQYEVPLGMAYNSYIIMDEKIAIMDTVDGHFTEEWLGNVKEVLGDKAPAYLILQHLEPDHSASAAALLEAYPNTVVVLTKPAVNMLHQFAPSTVDSEKLIVNEGDELSLGKHNLNFRTAAMVHWPEVMMTYDQYDKVLFSADAFGKFGSNAKEDPEGWDCEARRYYFGICGKYGMQVQAALKKLEGLEIEYICSLHGPILHEEIDHCLNLYRTWSSYEAEDDGIFIAYASIYGHTKEAALFLEEELQKRGYTNYKIADLCREDIYECVENGFRFSKLVLASVTYDASVMPVMREYIEHLVHRNYQKRTVAFVENGSWAPLAAKNMKAMLEGCKEINYLDSVITIKGTLTEENKEGIKHLAEQLVSA
ncbi:MAG: FprA family A-type flavoprotein [Solobacterium sp.]|nr:FprA family A-type flavoprotein [Solobacterium sp.]